MTTRLLLIRHGATTATAEDRFAGSIDVELSELGRSQAQRLATRLSREPVQAIYSSPFSRTLETATIVGAPHGLQPIVEPGLREIDHGHWEGRTRQEVEQAFCDEYASWEQDPFTFAPEGGESGASVIARALPVVRQIVLAHPGRIAALVSHKATIRLVLAGLLGIDARGYRDRLDQAPACLNVVDFKDPVRARLMVYNDTSHYAERPRESAAHLSKWWDEKEPR